MHPSAVGGQEQSRAGSVATPRLGLSGPVEAAPAGDRPGA